MLLRPGVPGAGPRARRVRAEGADDLGARAGHHGRHAGQAREHPRLQGSALSRSVTVGKLIYSYLNKRCSAEEIRAIVEDVGCCIAGQTSTLCPADK